MHDESINHTASATGSTDPFAALDTRIVQALENLPEVHIPADFAARVASQVPARPAISLRATHYGKTAMLLSIAVLLLTLLALARYTHITSAFGLTLQWTLCAQFIGLVVWLSMRRYSVD
jgi:hypothetical protein